MKRTLIFLVITLFFTCFNKAVAFETRSDLNDFSFKIATYYYLQYYESEYMNKTSKEIKSNSRMRFDKFLWLTVDDYFDGDEEQVQKNCSSCYVQHKKFYDSHSSLTFKTSAVRLKIKIKF